MPRQPRVHGQVSNGRLSSLPRAAQDFTDADAAFEPDPALVRALLSWYRRHQRKLPWREKPDPYRVWVSEMMLQQTQVKTVVDYYERWMQRFPDLASLARADVDAVLHAWQGLGYYARARRLLEGARIVVRDHRAKLPSDVDALRQLPGIGEYTAGAIASIAFGKSTPVVDGNVTRVLSRLIALEGDPSRQLFKRRLHSVAAALVPEECPGDFNQALMELGATVCTPSSPLCHTCPFQGYCRAHAEGREEQFPRKIARPKLERVRMFAALIERQAKYLVVKMPKDAPLWAGMWLFPTTALDQRRPRKEHLVRDAWAKTGLWIDVGARATQLTHSVTRYRIELQAYFCKVQGGQPKPRAYAAVAWKTPHELSVVAMPAAHRKISRVLLQT